MATRDIKKLAGLDVVKKPEFDPTKNYTWESKEMFGITGSELERLNMAFSKQATNAPDFEKFLWIQEGMNIINNVIKEGFDEGLVKQVVPKEEIVEPKEKMKVVKEKEEPKSE